MMHTHIVYCLLVLLQSTAWAVTVSPRCNADNCLRGLFGSNAKTVSANLAACSTGLPTVTISLDGTSMTTMTGTAAAPAAASVCDGQGISKRAARFQSACSCVGIVPSTVTQTATQSASSTISQMVTQTSPGSPQVTLGQLATAKDGSRCLGRYDFIKDGSTTLGQTYVAPRTGQIVSATAFDPVLDVSGTPAPIGYATFEVWRPLGNRQFELVGKSEPLHFTGSGTVISYTFQPIDVQAGDTLGVRVDNAGAVCAIIKAGTDRILYRYGAAGTQGQGSANLGDSAFFDGVVGGRLLNLVAILQ